jgi:DNA-directed RNA polymerase specialized sigma24 family protein
MWSNWVLSGSCNGASKVEPDEPDLVRCAQQAWPHVLAHVRKELAQGISAQEKSSLALEVWESVLRSVSRTLRRGQSRNGIEDMESYLVGVFHHRFNRLQKREERRQKVIEFLPTANDLAGLPAAGDRDWVTRLENEILAGEILAYMEDWARKVWVRRAYGYSWGQIASFMGLTEDQLKKRFRYSLEKTRKGLPRHLGEGRTLRRSRATLASGVQPGV